MDLDETLLGGQSFSWVKEDNTYISVLNNKVYKIKSLLDCEKDDFLISYFDLDYDYAEARRYLSSLDVHLHNAVKEFPDLRILKQDPVTTLIMFIVSQRNNIKRITNTHQNICQMFSKKVGDYYSFPSIEELKKVNPEDLDSLKLGFRKPYILDALTKLDITENIKSLNCDDKKTELLKIKGVGTKVADCILAFAYQERNVFAKDVWINRVLDVLYPGVTEDIFYPYKALAGQYLFSYARRHPELFTTS